MIWEHVLLLEFEWLGRRQHETSDGLDLEGQKALCGSDVYDVRRAITDTVCM